MNTYYNTDSGMAPNRRTFVRNMGIAATVGGLTGCAGVSKTDTTTTQQNSGEDGGGSDGNESETTTTTVTPGKALAWHARNNAEAAALALVLETFNGESPHKIDASDLSDLEKKTTSAIPAGNGPHIFEWAHDWVGDYYQRGFLSDQSGKVDVNLEETFTSAAAGAPRFDGALVGLPHAAETVALLYNKDLVDEPPETVSEMKSVMDEHHDPSSGTYGLSYPINPYFISAWAQAFGGYYYDEEKNALGLTMDETLKGFRIVLEDFLPYMPNDTAYGAQAAAFVDGKAPFAINGPWFLSSATEKGIDVGVTKLPKPEGGSPSPYTGISLWYFTKKLANTEEANANAARAFTEWYVTNEDIALRRAKESGDIPVLKSLQGSDELPESVKGFSKAVAQGVPMPTDPRMNKVWDPVATAIGKAMNGDASLEDAMATAEQNIKSEWNS